MSILEQRMSRKELRAEGSLVCLKNLKEEERLEVHACFGDFHRVFLFPEASASLLPTRGGWYFEATYCRRTQHSDHKSVSDCLWMAGDQDNDGLLYRYVAISTSC